MRTVSERKKKVTESLLGKAGIKKGTAFIKKRLPLSFYASNESKSMLARDFGDCRDNLRNSRSVFLIVS